MGSNTSLSIDQSQTISNSSLNAVVNQCTARCDQIQSGNVVIIQGSTIGGNVTFDQECKATMTCEINNNLETDVSNILDAISKQTSVTAKGFPDFNFDNVNQSLTSKQIITNSLTNLINNSCSASSTQIQNNNYTYVSNSTIAGSLQFTQKGDASAACVLTNRSAIKLANKASASASQSSTILGTGGIILALIVVVIIIIGVVFFISRLKKGKGGGGGASAEDIATAVTLANANAVSVPAPV
jgi:ATP-dependent Zn protease